MDLWIVKFLNHLAVGMVEDVGPFRFGIQFHFPGNSYGFRLAVFVDFGKAPLLEGKEAFAVFADFQSTSAGSQFGQNFGLAGPRFGHPKVVAFLEGGQVIDLASVFVESVIADAAAVDGDAAYPLFGG